MAVRQITICDRKDCNVEDGVESFSVRRTGGARAVKLDLCTEHSVEIRAVLDADEKAETPAEKAAETPAPAKKATAKTA